MLNAQVDPLVDQAFEPFVGRDRFSDAAADGFFRLMAEVTADLVSTIVGLEN